MASTALLHYISYSNLLWNAWHVCTLPSYFIITRNLRVFCFWQLPLPSSNLRALFLVRVAAHSSMRFASGFSIWFPPSLRSCAGRRTLFHPLRVRARAPSPLHTMLRFLFHDTVRVTGRPSPTCCATVSGGCRHIIPFSPTSIIPNPFTLRT